ncbi:hypothetical protein CPB86DRAFT_753375 [Serendipita vermifera]|nr:hypothetical protein CPB86DRAFT_753375 [Serendipita vermifera]
MYANEKRPTTPLNDKLPFDILFAIFDQYSIGDGINDPLEKLLSICKSWSMAATEHKALWATFQIESASTEVLRFWSSRVSTRIERSGNETLLNVTIRGYAFMENPTSRQEHADLISKLTRDIIGENCSLVKRWRHISVWYSLKSLQNLWNEALSQPTPNLRSLQLRYLNCQEPILPFAPLLEELTVYNCSINLCGDLKQLKLLRIDSRAMEIQNLDVVSKSPNLTTLEMYYCYRFFRLPPHFPVLQNLILRGSLEMKIMENFSAPLLRSLSLSLDPEVDCGALTECQGIDLTQLTTLHLDCSIPEDIYPEHSVTWAIMGLKGVIEAATNVQNYYVKGIKTLTLLLLYFEETLNSGIRSHSCTLKAKFYDKKISKLVESTLYIGADSLQTDIRRIREFAHLPLDDTLQTFIERLAHPSETKSS